MDRNYEQLIDQYRVSCQDRSAKDWLAYFAGGFLLSAPLLPGVAVPMAIFGTAYFLLVFALLLSMDSNRSLKPVIQEDPSPLQWDVNDQTMKLKQVLVISSQLLKNAFKNSLLLTRARAR